MRKLSILSFLIIVSLITNGCTFIFQKGRRTDIEKISELKKELSELERAKAELGNHLKKKNK